MNTKSPPPLHERVRDSVRRAIRAAGASGDCADEAFELADEVRRLVLRRAQEAVIFRQIKDVGTDALNARHIAGFADIASTEARSASRCAAHAETLSIRAIKSSDLGELEFAEKLAHLCERYASYAEDHASNARLRCIDCKDHAKSCEIFRDKDTAPAAEEAAR